MASVFKEVVKGAIAGEGGLRLEPTKAKIHKKNREFLAPCL